MIKKLGIFIFAALNLVGLCAGAALIFFSISQPLKPTKAVDSFKDMSAEEYLKHFNVFGDKPILYKMDAFTVNLANQDEDKVVQVEVNFEMLDERSYEEVMSKSASVRDTIVKILAQKASTDIASIQGKLYLKDDISLEINKQLDYGFIKGVYFTRFFIQ